VLNNDYQILLNQYNDLKVKHDEMRNLIDDMKLNKSYIEKQYNQEIDKYNDNLTELSNNLIKERMEHDNDK